MMYAQENEGFIALERCLYAEGWSWAHKTAVPTYPSITDTNKSLDKSYQCPAAKSHELSVYRVYGAFKYSLDSTFEKKSRLAFVLVNPIAETSQAQPSISNAPPNQLNIRSSPIQRT